MAPATCLACSAVPTTDQLGCYSGCCLLSTHSWPSAGIVTPLCVTLRLLSRVYPPLILEVLTSCFNVLVLPPRPFRTEKPLTQDAFHLVSLFLQKRCAYPELCENHDGPGALLLTPRLDAQTSFAKLLADLGTKED